MFKRKPTVSAEQLMAMTYAKVVDEVLPGTNTDRNLVCLRAGALHDPKAAAATGAPPEGLQAALFQLGRAFGETMVMRLDSSRASFVDMAGQCDRPVHAELFAQQAAAIAVPHARESLGEMINRFTASVGTV